jgi:hypothetical protein
VSGTTLVEKDNGKFTHGRKHEHEHRHRHEFLRGNVQAHVDIRVNSHVRVLTRACVISMSAFMLMSYDSFKHFFLALATDNFQRINCRIF